MSEIENLKIDGGATYIVGNQDIIANEWEASKTYVKGKSYVIQEHRLYVCNTTHTSTSPFDPTNWTEITIGDALGSLNGTTLPLTTNPADGTVSEAIGDLSTLTTTDKSSLVGAVNEKATIYPIGAIDNTTKTITFSGTVRFLLLCSGGSNGRMGVYWCLGRGSTSWAQPLLSSVNATITASDDTITITTSTSNIYFHLLIIDGDSSNFVIT